MSRLFIAVVVALCLIYTSGPVRTSADHQLLFDIPPYGNLDKYNPAIKELRSTGVHRWTYVQEPSGRDIAAPLITALEEYSLEFAVFMQHDPRGWRQIASGGMDFIYGNSAHAACGSWASACVADFLTSIEAAVYDSIPMASWPVRSVVEVALHEDGHLFGNFAEGYRHGEAQLCAGTSPFNLSVMGCGLINAQRIGMFERMLWRLSHGVEKPVPCVDGQTPNCYGKGNNGADFFYFCRTDAKATKVALLAYRLSDGRYRFTGEFAPVAPSGCQGYHVSNWRLEAGEVACWNTENGASTLVGRVDVCVPQ